ncbi:MAG: lipocalin family protein [Hyphomonadaceae bacterium]|nr:lipocalin family protein [Hyphomonadaceae bacterium]
MIRTTFALAALALLSACVTQPVYRQSTAQLPVADVETERYLGLWYEAARLPNWFQRDCTDVTAEYGLRDDGLISVTNTCRGGRERVAEGRAKRVGEGEEGKLKVSFFGPFFFGDYWVLERADDYSWSIVGEPRGSYLWVLTRSDGVTDEQRRFFEARITALGYRPSDLIWDE